MPFCKRCLASNFLLGRSDHASRCEGEGAQISSSNDRTSLLSFPSTAVSSSVSLEADSDIFCSVWRHLKPSRFWFQKNHTRWLSDTSTWTMIIPLDLIHVTVDLNLCDLCMDRWNLVLFSIHNNKGAKQISEVYVQIYQKLSLHVD